MSHAYAARGLRQTALPITPLAPEEKPIPVLESPDVNLEGFTAEISVAEPGASTRMTGEAGSTTGSPAAHDQYLAPRLRTRSESLAASRRLNEEGRVIAQVLIDAKGAAVHWSVARISGFPKLDEATACVLRKLEFVAGRRDGQAVAAEAMLPIVFRLD